jgi:hypothetical protein
MKRETILKAIISVLAFILVIAILFPLTVDKRMPGTYVARLLQDSADAYALSNDGRCARSYRDLYPFFPGGSHHVGGKAGVLPKDPFVCHAPLYIGPPQEQTSDPNYLVDLPPPAVAELFTGHTSYLKELRKPGCFGYGTTADQKKFAIVGFRPDHDGMPMYSFGTVMVLTNHGGHRDVVGERGACTPVMELVQAGADAYASSNNERCASSYRDLYPFFPGGSRLVGGRPGTLPRDPSSGPDDWDSLFDLPQPVVADLLSGDTSSLEKMRKPDCIGYGASSDQARFVIVAFRHKRLGGMPMYFSESVLVLTDHGGYQVIDRAQKCIHRVVREGSPNEDVPIPRRATNN